MARKVNAGQLGIWRTLQEREYRNRGMLTADEWIKITEAFELGMTWGEAADLINMKRLKLRKIVKRERPGLYRIKRAENTKHHYRRIYDGERNWQASTWWLERHNPRRFGALRAINSEATEEQVIRTRKIVRRMAEDLPRASAEEGRTAKIRTRSMQTA